MNISKTLSAVAILGALLATPALAARFDTPTDPSSTMGANVNSGGSNSNGSGGVQVTTRHGGQVTIVGGGQCTLKTSTGREKIIACPPGVGVN